MTATELLETVTLKISRLSIDCTQNRNQSNVSNQLSIYFQ